VTRPRGCGSKKLRDPMTHATDREKGVHRRDGQTYAGSDRRPLRAKAELRRFAFIENQETLPPTSARRCTSRNELKNVYATLSSAVETPAEDQRATPRALRATLGAGFDVLECAGGYPGGPQWQSP
jgi:hypothetical protein